MFLFVGLGNPGDAYRGHRHNVGFMAADAIAEAHRFGPERVRLNAWVREGVLAGRKALIVKPSTYMNDSGRAVEAAMRFYKISLDDVLVAHDEVDLAPGKIRVKRGGSDAGHNGLRSITAHTGPDYRRLRIGVSKPGPKEATPNWVLSNFSKAEKAWLEPLLEAIAAAAPLLAEGDDAGFMNRVAVLTRPPEPPAPAAQRTDPPSKAQKD